MFKACGMLSCVSESAVLDVSNDPIDFIISSITIYLELIDCQDKGRKKFQNFVKYIPKDTMYREINSFLSMP
jgi:hypothetical protein